MVFIQRPIFVGMLFAVVEVWAIAPVHAGEMQHQPLSHFNGRFFIEGDGQIVEIPNITSFCLGCHDGTSGQARQGPVENNLDSTARCRSLPGAHPVEVLFPVGKKNIDFADLASLPHRMLLVEGRVTCVACHDMQAENHTLVVDNRHSALCLTCHRK